MTNDETARMLLEAVIEGGEPVASDEMGNVFCLWCEAAKLDDGTRFVHPAVCTWSRIRVFLAREAPASPVEELAKRTLPDPMNQPLPVEKPALIRDHEFTPRVMPSLSAIDPRCSYWLGDRKGWCHQPRERHVQASPEEKR